MRFSIASVSAVVLAAVSLVTAARCDISSFDRTQHIRENWRTALTALYVGCLQATKMKNGGNQIANCQGVIYDPGSTASKLHYFHFIVLNADTDNSQCRGA